MQRQVNHSSQTLEHFFYFYFYSCGMIIDARWAGLSIIETADPLRFSFECTVTFLQNYVNKMNKKSSKLKFCIEFIKEVRVKNYRTDLGRLDCYRNTNSHSLQSWQAEKYVRICTMLKVVMNKLEIRRPHRVSILSVNNRNLRLLRAQALYYAYLCYNYI